MTVTQEQVARVMDNVMADLAGMAGVHLTMLGLRAGLWEAMAGAGPLTPAELAERSRTNERLVAEWLKGQAAGGYVGYASETGRFELPAAVAAVLAEEPSASLVRGLAQLYLAVGKELPPVEMALRTGEAVGWDGLLPEHWEGMDVTTTAAVSPVLVPAWLPALEGVEDKLRRGARVADIGCGYGAPLIAMAEAYPASGFSGFDYHDTSVAEARKAAARAGVGDRVRFEVAGATDFPVAGYDLVTFFDCLHDLGDPVAALSHTRQTLAADGTVLLVEWHAGDQIQDNFTPFGRLMYAASVTVCTPNALSQGGQALGTLPGERRLREVAVAAGFSRVRRVPVDAPLNLLLELKV